MNRARMLLTGVVLLVTMRVAPATALCAPHAPAGSFMRAEVVFTGVALDGANVGGMLTDPVSFKVAEYQKGSGPAIVQVETGTSGNGEYVGTSSTGLTASAGRRFQIFGTVEDDVVKTSACAGSRGLKEREIGFAAAQTRGGEGIIDDTTAPGGLAPRYGLAGASVVGVWLVGVAVLVYRRRRLAIP